MKKYIASDLSSRHSMEGAGRRESTVYVKNEISSVFDKRPIKNIRSSFSS